MKRKYPQVRVNNNINKIKVRKDIKYKVKIMKIFFLKIGRIYCFKNEENSIKKKKTRISRSHKVGKFMFNLAEN